jgi:hypothetical protein
MSIPEAVDEALALVAEDPRSAPARAVARLLAGKLAGDCSNNEAAALARELRQTLATIVPPVENVDQWARLLGELGTAE